LIEDVHKLQLIAQPLFIAHSKNRPISFTSITWSAIACYLCFYKMNEHLLLSSGSEPSAPTLSSECFAFTIGIKLRPNSDLNHEFKSNKELDHNAVDFISH
jgi:hypothetical protein